MDISTLSRPIKALDLVRGEFGANLQDMKVLTPEDRLQLASGIAMNYNIPDTELGFKPVMY